MFAYKLIPRESVEEKIPVLQEKKHVLAKNIMIADNSIVKWLTKDVGKAFFS